MTSIWQTVDACVPIILFVERVSDYADNDSEDGGSDDGDGFYGCRKLPACCYVMMGENSLVRRNG